MGYSTKGVIAIIKGVILIGVGRNLNRVIRTCYTFGIYNVYCFNCDGKPKGSLFSAANRVLLHEVQSLDDLPINKTLGLEVTESLPLLHDYPVRDVEYLAIGGESTTLRRSSFTQMARIQTENSLCLTTEAALAIALYDILRRV